MGSFFKAYVGWCAFLPPLQLTSKSFIAAAIVDPYLFGNDFIFDGEFNSIAVSSNELFPVFNFLVFNLREEKNELNFY